MTTKDSYWMWTWAASDGSAQQQIGAAYTAFHQRFARPPRRALVHESVLQDGLRAPVGVDVTAMTWQARRSILFALDEEATRR